MRLCSGWSAVTCAPIRHNDILIWIVWRKESRDSGDGALAEEERGRQVTDDTETENRVWCVCIWPPFSRQPLVSHTARRQ